MGEKLTWNFHDLDHLHQAVNSTLRYAMQNERCKRWTKVAETYKLLLWLIDKNNLPDDYEPPASYDMLLYETYYHIGVALQHLGNHKKAAENYTKAINTVSIPKNGCLAGCVTNSCLMTPLYARRAFAYVRQGDMKNAMKDAEKTVVLDSKNPDVYCVRALVKSSNDDEGGAIKDVELALKLKPGHLCSLTLRSSLTKPLAQRMETDSETFMNVTSFKHPCIMEFYDKIQLYDLIDILKYFWKNNPPFLFTLCVPHTIVQVDLTPDKPSKKQIDSQSKILKQRPASAPERISVEPFKCGMTSTDSAQMSTRRRQDYGEAIRKHMGRPKTAAAFFVQLEQERKKQADIEEMERRRAVSAGVKRLNETALVSGTAHAISHTKMKEKQPSYTGNHTMQIGKSTTILYMEHSFYLKRQHKKSENFETENKENVGCSKQGDDAQRQISSPKRKTGRVTIREKEEKRPQSSATSNKFTIPTPVNYTTPVFQPVNLRDAPRMYYKPWKGDKLPVAEVQRPVLAPAWR